MLTPLTSAQNPRLKLVRLLQQKRDARERERLFVAEGARLTDDFLRAGMKAHFALVAAGDAASSAAQQWARAHAGVECFAVSDSIMRDVSLETTPPGMLVVFHMPEARVDAVLAELRAPVMILDALRDPGNLGACLRVAAGADCRVVLLAPGSVDPFNPKVVRGGMGAHARIQVAAMSWDEIRATCRGRAVWAATANGQRRYDQVAWAEPSAVIIGGEASGISREAQAHVTGTTAIPLANAVESLNAAVACGVILFEAARQRVNSKQ
jgi:RNA methyltransferase, TrmH family